MRHVVGSPSADDVLVHEEKDPRLELSIHKTLDDAFILIHGQGTTTTEVWAVDARDNAAPFLVAPRKENVTQMVEHGQGRFFLLTNEGAPNFKLLTSTDPAQVAWRDLVPHRPDISMSEMVVMDGAVVLLAREDAVPHWRLVDVATGKEKVVRLDSPAHMLMPGVNLEASAPAFRFGSASFTQAGSTLEVDLRTGLVRTLKTRHVPGYDATRYQEQRLNVVSADGAVIPVVVVAARGTPRDGTAPGLLTAYGAYGIAMDPAFDPSLLPLLDRGMVVVLAQVRGGDERGGAWRDGGRLKEKHHTFEDVITVAQALHKDGWVARNRLALRGGSAGGLLVGAVINLRPDLFAAAVAEVPFVDVLHTMLDADAPLTAQEYEEWGNPNEPEAFAVMAAYSPYDNLKPQDHPAMLVTAGINDPRVRFFEAARYVAKLRTLKTDRNVVLLKVLMDSGHSGVTGLNAAAEEEAWVQAFLMEALAMAH
jgi:oligopeptidase B